MHCIQYFHCKFTTFKSGFTGSSSRIRIFYIGYGTKKQLCKTERTEYLTRIHNQFVLCCWFLSLSYNTDLNQVFMTKPLHKHNSFYGLKSLQKYHQTSSSWYNVSTNSVQLVQLKPSFALLVVPQKSVLVTGYRWSSLSCSRTPPDTYGTFKFHGKIFSICVCVRLLDL